MPWFTFPRAKFRVKRSYLKRAIQLPDRGLNEGGQKYNGLELLLDGRSREKTGS